MCYVSSYVVRVIIRISLSMISVRLRPHIIIVVFMIRRRLIIRVFV